MSSSLRYRCQRTEQWITLTHLIADSGEAKVWNTDRAGSVAKIYHHPDPQRRRKLELMVLYRPSDPNARQGHISFAWPDSILETDRGEGIGFLMQEAENSLDLLKISTPKYREDAGIKLDWYFLHVVARNIAGIIQAIHHEGYVLGDIKLQNILVNNKALPTIIDTDSFQVRDPYTSQIHRCLVATEEFTPPELIGLEVGNVDQTEVHDRFRLGVVIHHLLFGQGPFQGRWQGSGEEPETVEWIQRGLWPYGPSGLVVPGRLTIPLEIIHPHLQACFLRCFNEGHRHPNRRPTAQDWWEAFEACLGQINSCDKVDNHRYSASYGHCYWCERAKTLGVDIFPGKPVKTPPPKPTKAPVKNGTMLYWNGIRWEKIEIEDKAKIFEKISQQDGQIDSAGQVLDNIEVIQAPVKPVQKPLKKAIQVPVQSARPIQTSTKNASKANGNYHQQLSNGIELEMIAIPAGWCLIAPQKKVKIKAFYFGKYPITQAQWQAVMGNNPSYFHSNPQNPVEKVSWNDCQVFCEKISILTSKVYRLPSEAEWEYASRVKTKKSCYHFGDNVKQLENYAWYIDNSKQQTHPVGQKKPNLWGLYDMYGNVWEWCQDGWHDNYDGIPTDGTAWMNNHAQTDLRVIRGGSWARSAKDCSSNYRVDCLRGLTSNDTGLRIVMELGRI